MLLKIALEVAGGTHLTHGVEMDSAFHPLGSAPSLHKCPLNASPALG